ncbi:MAG: hypothetical protein HYV02_03735 [Deltaproteobacteria bacterium]|nr:hypothetical protein [Deltaproteobacteria bacterium]
MRLLIVADPLGGLRPESDTSLALATEGIARGHDLWWAEDGEIALSGVSVIANAVPITSIAPYAIPTVGGCQMLPIEQFDIVLIRKNPPFDEGYLRLCWLLAPYESRVVVSNRASVLLRYHEKLLPLCGVQAGFFQADEIVPTILTRDPAFLQAFMAEHRAEAWVVKPWTGFGGRGVERYPSAEAVLAAVAASPTPMLVSPFLPEVMTTGDRRVFYLRGQMVGDLVRIPPPGGFIANLAFGGHGTLHGMSDRTRHLCAQLGNFLRSIDCDFAGADLLGDRLSEVNITSPTGINTLVRLGGPSLAGPILDAITGHVVRKEGG